MSGKSRLQVDLRRLRRIAGAKIFERGEDYHASNLVEIIDIGAKRVVARVFGTEVYRTIVRQRGPGTGWECSCPAMESWSICKHVVAVALAANGARENAPEVAASSRIRAHLMRQDTTKLVRMIMSLAERDMNLFLKLSRASDGKKRIRRARAD